MLCPRSGRDRQTCSPADPDHLHGPKMGCARYIQDWSGTKAMRGRRSENKGHRVFLFPKRSLRCESIEEYTLRLLSDKRRHLQYRSDSDEARAGDVLEMAAKKD